ncbi:hypothetical protein EGW08_001149, partial [Elysia chlorotica]
IAFKMARQTVSELQEHLKARGIVTSGMKRGELSDLCARAREFDVLVDPDGLTEDRHEVLSSKLCVDRLSLKNPAIINGAGNADLHCLPMFTVVDIFSYLMTNK